MKTQHKMILAPKTILAVSAGVMLSVAFAQVAPAQRRGDGGARGNASSHRSANASRGANRGPAMSRSGAQSRAQSRPQARPQTRPGAGSGMGANRTGGSKPSVNRPTTGSRRPNPPQRPTAGNSKLPASRPNLSSNRPGQGSGIRRPGATGSPRPSRGASSEQLNDFLGNKGPSSGPGGLQRPGTKDRPNLRDPGAGDEDRPNLGNLGTGNNDRPNLGNLGSGDNDRPNLGNLGSGDNDRPNLGNLGSGDRDRPILGDRDGDKIGQIGSRDVNVGNVNVGNSVDFSKDQKAWMNNRQLVGNQVRLNAGNRYTNAYRTGAYRRGVVGGYPYYNSWGSRGGYYGWGAPTAAAFGTFLGATAANNLFPQRTYYAYGSGGNVYYENNAVYVNGTDVGTPQEYAEQAISYVAAAPPPEQTSEQEWLPLGVFAFTQEDVDDSQAMIEIAVNKQAVLAGTYYNEATQVSRPLKGTIDQESQRAVLGFADGENTDIALEMGMFNLTLDEVPGLLHRGTDDSSPVLLVRLQDPEGEGP